MSSAWEPVDGGDIIDIIRYSKTGKAIAEMGIVSEPDDGELYGLSIHRNERDLRPAFFEFEAGHAVCRQVERPPVPVEAIDEVMGAAAAMLSILAMNGVEVAKGKAALDTLSAWLATQEAQGE